MATKYPKCGFYWVCRKNTTPEIAYCWGLYWTVSGQDKPLKRENFEFIDPNPINPPGYSHMKQFPATDLTG
jgi:hypothetical protein